MRTRKSCLTGRSCLAVLCLSFSSIKWTKQYCLLCRVVMTFKWHITHKHSEEYLVHSKYPINAGLWSSVKFPSNLIYENYLIVTLNCILWLLVMINIFHASWLMCMSVNYYSCPLTTLNWDCSFLVTDFFGTYP